MDYKPWKDGASHRTPFGGREERSDRRDNRRFHSSREEGDRRFGHSKRREDRTFVRGEAPRGRFDRERFGVRSGPRARSLETRRYADRTDFAKQRMVRLDADIADFFDSPEAVNEALRMLILAAKQVSKLNASAINKPSAKEGEESHSEESSADIIQDPFEEDGVDDSESTESKNTP